MRRKSVVETGVRFLQRSTLRGLSALERNRHMVDRSTSMRAFEGAGMQSVDAEQIATEIYDAILAASPPKSISTISGTNRPSPFAT